MDLARFSNVVYGFVVRQVPKKISDLLTVSEAASVLGVSPSTLRNWDRNGKLVPVRNPINGYRLYRRADLEKILSSLEGDHHHAN